MKQQVSENFYDKILAVYLTPKVLRDIKQRGSNLSKMVKEAKQASKNRYPTVLDGSTTMDYGSENRYSSVALPEIVSRNRLGDLGASISKERASYSIITQRPSVFI